MKNVKIKDFVEQLEIEIPSEEKFLELSNIIFDGEKAEKFKEASAAYHVLSNAERKQNYDRFGHAAFENGAG